MAARSFANVSWQRLGGGGAAEAETGWWAWITAGLTNAGPSSPSINGTLHITAEQVVLAPDAADAPRLSGSIAVLEGLVLDQPLFGANAVEFVLPTDDGAHVQLRVSFPDGGAIDCYTTLLHRHELLRAGTPQPFSSNDAPNRVQGMAEANQTLDAFLLAGDESHGDRVAYSTSATAAARKDD
ncbi:uncharacterized protein MONBRDRAFT_28010 [Monosiga brevicollis MX1]|uniref:Uncharacterized protein n=1 Tax=Monosiga brevicollis TaxID=81824 RepID=A9V6Y1_MONBE|nr:uncharacterized protein MONBRDRAFT_28010 [Monosiga brevicollis MX1]EDQ86695.1 predicted protein [Monosiga brevicollis MX1]|eukprot:XP_001748531.1 hypothetical protein [Monosiga brevicollis MX1]